jgi:hypothetical protein
VFTSLGHFVLGRRSRDRIRYVERPHDLEAREHGKDIVVELESFPDRVASEIAAMSIEPPISLAVPFPLVSSKRLIDLRQRLNRYLGGPPDEPWTTLAVYDHDEIARPRSRLATVTVITRQAGRGPLDPGHVQIGQFGRHLRAVAERSNDIIVVIEPCVAAKSLPECIGIGGSRQYPASIPSPSSTGPTG